MQIQTPDWVKHAVFYQIFPDRFARRQFTQNQSTQNQSSHHQSTVSQSAASQSTNDQPSHPSWLRGLSWEDWEAAPTLQGYKGGDLWGVLEKLDYLEDLGITAIYFTPIFQSACNHRYHTHDYYQVDPILGGNSAFRALLDEAHRRGMKVVLDGVFNHCSRGFFFFNDILENGPHSPWLDWFRIEGWPLAAYDGDRPANYVGWFGNRALPVFNHDHPDVREYLMQIAEYWLAFGIDGWRLDVPFEIKTPGFWQEFRDRVKTVNPEAYIVGEVWGDAQEWLDGSQFDGVMNYLFTAPTIAFTAGDRVILEYVEDRSYDPYPALNAAGYATKIQQLLERYDWQIHLTQLNLLASHDTARLLTIAGNDKASVELATLLLFTFPGAPSLYYGDEVGLPGAIDPDSRRGFPAQATWDLALLDYHRQLIALRHAYPALRIGDYQTLYAEGDVYVFARILNPAIPNPAPSTMTMDKTIGGNTTMNIVAVNVGLEAAKITISTPTIPPQSSSLTHLFGLGKAEWLPDAQLLLDLPARSGCISG